MDIITWQVDHTSGYTEASVRTTRHLI